MTTASFLRLKMKDIYEEGSFSGNQVQMRTVCKYLREQDDVDADDVLEELKNGTFMSEQGIRWKVPTKYMTVMVTELKLPSGKARKTKDTWEGTLVACGKSTAIVHMSQEEAECLGGAKLRAHEKGTGIIKAVPIADDGEVYNTITITNIEEEEEEATDATEEVPSDEEEDIWAANIRGDEALFHAEVCAYKAEDIVKEMNETLLKHAEDKKTRRICVKNKSWNTRVLDLRRLLEEHGIKDPIVEEYIKKMKKTKSYKRNEEKKEKHLNKIIEEY